MRSTHQVWTMLFALAATTAGPAHAQSRPAGNPLESLPIYTSLFNKLGFVGVGCTVIAVGMLPLMRKLSLNHALAGVPPVPPVHNEDL